MTSNKRIARMGNKLRIHYVCRDDEGNILESTCEGKDAPTIVLGRGEILDALEKALCGMASGDTKLVKLSPQEAFGEYDPEMVDEVPKDQLETNIPPEVGMEFEFTDEDGEIYTGVVSEINDDMVMIDCNHPLAGMNLSFELTLEEIL